MKPRSISLVFDRLLDDGGGPRTRLAVGQPIFFEPSAEHA